MFRARDFIETPEGLIFSVVLDRHPREGIASHLRFERTKRGLRRIGSSEEAYRLLREKAPHYLSFSRHFDTTLTRVPKEKVVRHYLPSEGLSRALEVGTPLEIEEIVEGLLSRSSVKGSDMGLTGSFLVGAQGPGSDIDLVVYGAENYSALCHALQVGVGDGTFEPLSTQDWGSLYHKRGGPWEKYSFPEFLWHEMRKWNRARLGPRRFDLLPGKRPGDISTALEDRWFKKIGKATVECDVIDARAGIDYPAIYRVSNCQLQGRDVREIVSFTHTYLDQVRLGERVLCAGSLEEVRDASRYLRIVVGTSREAPREFLKVKGLRWNP